MVACIQWHNERENIPQARYTVLWKKHLLKNGNLRVCWDLIQVNKFPSLLTMTYQREIWDVTFVSDNCGMTCQKKYLLNKLYFLVRALNKPDISPREEIYGVSKKS